MHEILASLQSYLRKLLQTYQQQPKTSSNTKNKNVDTTPRYKNDNQTGISLGNLRAVNVVGLSENTDTDEEIDEHEWKHITVTWAKIQEVLLMQIRPLIAEPLDTAIQNPLLNPVQWKMGDSNVIHDLTRICVIMIIQDDQNDVECGC
ncbi:hypothetical protein Tco_0635048 [Tanacetum coccineum]